MSTLELVAKAARDAGRQTVKDVERGWVNPADGERFPDIGWSTLSRLGDPAEYEGDNNRRVAFYREYRKQNPGATPEQALDAAERRAAGDRRYVDDGRTKMKVQLMGHEQSETVQRGDGRWVNVYGAKTPNAGQPLPDSGDFGTVDEAVTAAKAPSAAHGNDIGFIPLPPKSEAKGDADFKKLPPKGISAEDRRAYTEALPGTPEGMKARESIEGKYGGREAFVKEYDPTGEYLGKNVVPLIGLSAFLGGVPGLIPAMAEGGAAGLSALAASPALRHVAVEALKWLGKGALGATGFEAARRMSGHK